MNETLSEQTYREYMEIIQPVIDKIETPEFACKAAFAIQELAEKQGMVSPEDSGELSEDEMIVLMQAFTGVTSQMHLMKGVLSGRIKCKYDGDEVLFSANSCYAESDRRNSELDEKFNLTEDSDQADGGVE